MGYKVSIWLQALTVQGSLWEKIPFFVPLKSIFFSFFSVIFWCNFSPFWHLDYVCVSLSRTYIAQSLKSIGIRNFFFHWDSNAYSMFEVCILTTYVLQPLWWSYHRYHDTLPGDHESLSLLFFMIHYGDNKQFIHSHLILLCPLYSRANWFPS